MKKGFTLVELIGVIVIIALLMVIAGTSVMSVLSSSRESLLQEQIDSLTDTLVTYAISEKYTRGISVCSDSFDPSNPTSSDSSCYVTFTVREVVESGYFENNDDLCDLDVNVMVYRTSVDYVGYVPEGTCSYS